MTPPNSTDSIEWAVAHCALPGQEVSGDRHLVQPHDRGVLLAVVDGIGHGPEATWAADLAVEALRQQPGDSVLNLIKRSHAALHQTRGVVLTAVVFDEPDRTVTWCGVGNVEGMLVRNDAVQEHTLLRGGTVGASLPPLHAGVVPVQPGDLLILASDGIRPDYERDLPVKGSPQRIADHILGKYFKGTDDACVLVTRFLDKETHA
ncbi:MAG: SpoIIE family protein phosphatase [Nibricoccus sp.]